MAKFHRTYLTLKNAKAEIRRLQAEGVAAFGERVMRPDGRMMYAVFLGRIPRTRPQPRNEYAEAFQSIGEGFRVLGQGAKYTGRAAKVAAPVVKTGVVKTGEGFSKFAAFVKAKRREAKRKKAFKKAGIKEYR